MKEIDAMIQVVNDLVSNRGDRREEILSDVLADCQAGWVENIRSAAMSIEHLREISHRSNPDTAEISSFLNSLVLRITSAISDVKAYDMIKNTIRNMD